MKSLELVLNGKSAANENVRKAVYQLRSEGTPVSVHVTWEAGDAARIASSFSGNSDAIVVAGGGDGTVNEVLNGLFSSDKCLCAMAILPLGTANDLASSAGIPLGDPYLALQLAAQTSPHAVDVGVMNNRYFLKVASGGFGAEVTSQTPTALKNVLGGSAYALEAMLMVSVGSGLLSRSIGLKDPKSVSFLESLPTAIQSMMFTGTTEQDLLCRSFSDVRAGDPIDSEVGPLLGSDSIGGRPLFSYARYNADLSPSALCTNGLKSLANVSFSIDSLDAIQPCVEVGKQVAESKVLASHFDGFWTCEN